MASAMIPPAAAYAATLAWICVPLMLWSVLASLELIAVRGAFLPGRALGTDLAALVRGRVRPVLLSSPACGPAALLAVPALRLAAGLALPFAGDAALVALLLVILGCTALSGLATHGGDGADKIAMVAGTAALLIALGRLLDDRLLCLAGLAWGAGQVTIAYVASGTAKLARGFWRDGSALAAALTSYRSGHALAARVVRPAGVARVLAWAIMLVETLFPLALVAGPATCIVLLATMALFHLATAIVMGLNTYPWAFMATYPCVVMANAILAQGLR